MAMYRSHVLICGGTGCISNGAAKVTEAMRRELVRRDLTDEVLVVPTGCHGMCEMGPIVVVYPEGTFYSRVTPEDIPEIVEEHLYKGRPVERLMYSGEGKCPRSLPQYSTTRTSPSTENSTGSP
ncbi:hypothetical protein MASR1M66_03300 [Aminivibrio sp.]